MSSRALAVILFAMAVYPAAADDRSEYNRRAANADLAAFKQLDLNGDGRVAENEAKADLNFYPRFRDIDINRDGHIGSEEIRRYIEQTYGIRPPG